MSAEAAAVATLGVTLILVVLIDRGVPNTLESIAFAVESASMWMVSALRRSASTLRKRHHAIELAHQERMAGASRYERSESITRSRSSSAAA